MNPLPKRGNVYVFSQTTGGKRLRVSLGVRTPDAAKCLIRQIGAAIYEGPKSEHWRVLRLVLPPHSYKTLASHIGLHSSPELHAFQKQWEAKLERRVKLGELAESSFDLYSKTAAVFFQWAEDNGIGSVDGFTPEVVERYLVWRKTGILAKGGSGRGLTTDHTTLQAIFNLALESELLRKSPLAKLRMPDAPAKGAEPFTPEEMERLAAVVPGEHRTAFLLLRHTGMRCSDIVAVTWPSINWTTKVLDWMTKKRKVWVHLPLVGELHDHLVWVKRDSGPILEGTTREQLYQMVRGWGREAGVTGATPHRFRDSRAVSILRSGGTIYDAARILGISVSTCDKFYSRFTDELQERVRGIMENAA